MNMKTALSIAGSDSSGGAGIQADMKTMATNGVYAMTAITALTAQNTTGVQGIHEVPADFLAMQIDSIFTDIEPDAVKIGMISSAELVEVIARKLIDYEARNIVVDPVMVATSGAALSKDSAIGRMKEILFPIATVITPNIPEAEALAGMTIQTVTQMEEAARKMGQEYGCAVLVKGGHAVEDASDVLWTGREIVWFHGKHIDNPNTHGTGCTLSSAIAANLAKGYDLKESISRAKDYISGALAAMMNLGAGRGPLNHLFDIQGEFAKGEKI